VVCMKGLLCSAIETFARDGVGSLEADDTGSAFVRLQGRIEGGGGVNVRCEGSG